MKRLDHSHMVDLRGSCIHLGKFYLIIHPFIETNLRDVLNFEDKILKQDHGLNWLICLSGTLAHIHQSMVVYRDIKPANILVRLNDGHIIFQRFWVFSVAG